MAEDLTINVDGSGQIQLENPRLRRWLKQRTGVWQLEPSVENLLIFKRPDGFTSEDSASGRIGKLQFTGGIAAMGGLMDVITFIHSSRRSGALVVLHQQIKKTLFFSDGSVRMATSNIKEDLLGALLYRFGMVSRAQLDEALAQTKNGKKLGQVLIQMGAITVHDLYTIIRRQIEEIFYSALLMKQGHFYFYMLENTAGLPAQISLDTQNLLLEGVSRMDEMSYFRDRIPNDKVVLEIRPDVNPKSLEERETKIYTLIDGLKTLGDLARESRLGEFETTKVVFNLMQLGYVRKRAEKALGTTLSGKKRGKLETYTALVEAFNEVFSKIYIAVMNKGTASILNSGLGSFFEGATGFADLFGGITLEDDGTLPVNTLITNLESADIENKVDFLYNGLNELLYFEMFTAGETLDRDDETRLQDQINSIFHELQD